MAKKEKAQATALNVLEIVGTKKEDKELSGKNIRFELVQQMDGQIISTLPQYSMMLQACEKALTTDGKKIGTGKALTAIKKGLYKGKAEICYVAGSSKKTTEGSRVKFLSPTDNINWETLELSRS